MQACRRGLGPHREPLIDVAGDFAMGRIWAARQFERARIAFRFLRPIEQRPAVMNPAGRPEQLTLWVSPLIETPNRAPGVRSLHVLTWPRGNTITRALPFFRQSLCQR
jgi:hypothetical protein